MRRLTVNTFMTLDGVMQAPGGPEEDISGGFKHGGWSVNYWDDKMGQIMDAYMDKPFDMLLGRKTYEIFAAYWPDSNDEPIASQFNRAHKYVASQTLKDLSWDGSSLLEGDVPTAVAKLKQGHGPEIQVHGSANLLQTLIKHGLIDRFQIFTFPLVLGTGKRLFESGTTPSGLQLTNSETSSTGVVICTYQPAGEINYGTFAAEDPSADEAARREKMASGR
jgi:dihydrofolate reductase